MSVIVRPGLQEGYYLANKKKSEIFSLPLSCQKNLMSQIAIKDGVDTEQRKCLCIGAIILFINTY